MIGSGSFVISWGPSGGLYFKRGYTTRLCLWRLAFTCFPDDIDDILADLTGFIEGVA